MPVTGLWKPSSAILTVECRHCMSHVWSRPLIVYVFRFHIIISHFSSFPRTQQVKSRTKEFAYGLYWKQNRKSCIAFLSLDSKLSMEAHMRWVECQIQNLEMYRRGENKFSMFLGFITSTSPRFIVVARVFIKIMWMCVINHGQSRVSASRGFEGCVNRKKSFFSVVICVCSQQTTQDANYWMELPFDAQQRWSRVRLAIF